MGDDKAAIAADEATIAAVWGLTPRASRRVTADRPRLPAWVAANGMEAARAATGLDRAAIRAVVASFLRGLPGNGLGPGAEWRAALLEALEQAAEPRKPFSSPP